MKTCFKCHQTKPYTEFYKHKMMADGHLGKCKECTKKDVAERYEAKREVIAEYEKKRFKDPARKAKVKVYRLNMRRRNPEKANARQKTKRAVESGKLVPQPCVRCQGLKVQAHHTDYSKPLEVTWMCFSCHRADHGQRVMNDTPSVHIVNPDGNDT